MIDNKFNFFIPATFEKSTDEAGKAIVKLKGVASSDKEDSDGETLIPQGFDFQPLLKTGFLNWNHQASKTAKAICGEPTFAKIIDNGKSFYIEGFLYPNEEGKYVADLAETLERYSPTRRLGFSIEGQALERDPLNEKKITRARITGVAITQSPKNPNTLMSLVKGEVDDFYISNDTTDSQVLRDFESGKLFASDGRLVTDRNEAMRMSLEEEEKNKKGGTSEKAMDTGAIGPAMPESVEGTEVKNVVAKINKSDVYIQIQDRYDLDDISKADDIYRFVITLNKKLFNMATISKDAISKAFEILDNIVKSDGADEQTVDKIQEKENQSDEEKAAPAIADTEGVSADDDIKQTSALSIAKGLVALGMAKEAVVKAMTSVGVDLSLAETSCTLAVEAASSLKENGGQISEEKIQKSLEDVLSKGLEPITQSLEEIMVGVSKKFAATGQILKAQVDQNSELKKAYEALKGELQKASEDIETLNNTPLPAKSVRSAKAIERFEKSEGAGGDIYSISNVSDVRRLSDRLMAEVDLAKSHNREDPQLEKAVMDLEISKSTDYAAITPRLKSLGITLVR